MSKKVRVTKSMKTRMELLREDGYQNADIAKNLGCSYATILNHIGPQPKEMTAKYRAIRFKAQKEKEETRVSIAREKRIKEAQEIYAKQAAIIRQAKQLEQETAQAKAQVTEAKRLYRESLANLQQFNDEVKQSKETYRKAARLLIKAGILCSSKPVHGTAVPDPADLSPTSNINVTH